MIKCDLMIPDKSGFGQYLTKKNLIRVMNFIYFHQCFIKDFFWKIVRIFAFSVRN